MERRLFQRRRNVFKIGGGGGGGRLCKIISYNFYCQSRRGGVLKVRPHTKSGGGGGGGGGQSTFGTQKIRYR